MLRSFFLVEIVALFNRFVWNGPLTEMFFSAFWDSCITSETSLSLDYEVYEQLLFVWVFFNTCYFRKRCLLVKKSSVQKCFSFWCFIIVRTPLTFLMASQRSFPLEVTIAKQHKIFLVLSMILVSVWYRFETIEMTILSMF